MARGPVGKYKCLKCSKDVSLIAKTRHDRSCDGVVRTYKAAHNKATDCVFCGRVFRSAIAALVTLGFQKAASQKAVATILKRSPSLEVEKVIKDALRML